MRAHALMFSLMLRGATGLATGLAQTSPPADLLVHAGRLFDVHTQQIQKRQTIVIHADRILRNIVQKILALGPTTATMFQTALPSGVKIAFGTDTGGQCRTGTSAQELNEMVRLGMKPADAIVSATPTAAQLIGVEGQIGDLAAGEFADVIAVSGKPEEDIRELEHLKFVMKGGVVYRNDAGKAP